MITVLIITTSILVGVSVKLYLDKKDLVEELDNVMENCNLRVCALDRELDAAKRLWEISAKTLEVFKHEAEKVHQELNGQIEELKNNVQALEIINEGCTNTYFNQANEIFELSAKLSTLRNELKKERNKSKQIKYDKQNNTIVDPEYLTELGNL